MTVGAAAWLALILAGVGTFAIRAAFPMIADRLVELPVPVARALRMIPPAVLAALVLPAFVRPDGEIDLSQPEFVAGLVAAVVGFATRNVIATLVVGMGVLLALDWPS